MVKQRQKQKERRRKCAKERRNARRRYKHGTDHVAYQSRLLSGLGQQGNKANNMKGKGDRNKRRGTKRTHRKELLPSCDVKDNGYQKKSSHPNLRHFLAPKKGMARVMHFIDEKICKYLDNYKHLLKTMTSTSSGYKIIH